jgi:hypothetical protein
MAPAVAQGPDGRTFPELSVALVAEAQSFDPDEFTARTGLMPTRIGRAGEFMPSGRPWRHDQWALRIGPRPALELEPLVLELFAAVGPNLPGVKSAASEMGLSLVIHCAIERPPALLRSVGCQRQLSRRSPTLGLS